jgi:bacterioferritin
LFHRPVRDERDNSRDDPEKYKKGVTLPDPQKESLHPTDDDSTIKALEMLKAALRKPDVTGSLEGKFKVPLEEMIRHLNRIISAEYSQWMRYYHYAIVLKGHCRDALAHEFEEHARQELEHVDVVAMRVVGLGGYPTTDMEHPAPLRDTDEILEELIRREQEGMQLYREVHALCGDNEGTRQVLEGNMAVEQDHIDELWRYLKDPTITKAGADQESAGREVVSEGRYMKEQQHSYERVAPGISGGAGPDLPERGRDWHGTVPGVPDEPQDDDEDDLDKPPENLAEPIVMASKALLANFNDPAIKALSGAPIFRPGPFVPPPEREWMIQHGYNEEDVDNGRVKMSSRQRAEFNRWLTSTVQKSLTGLMGFEP